MLNAESALPIDPIEPTLPTDPIDSVDPRLAMLKNESSDRIDHFDDMASACRVSHVRDEPGCQSQKWSPCRR